MPAKEDEGNEKEEDDEEEDEDDDEDEDSISICNLSVSQIEESVSYCSRLGRHGGIMRSHIFVVGCSR